MFSQTAQFQCSRQDWDEIIKKLSTWKRNHAHSVNGLSDIVATRSDETGDSIISVIFNSEQDLHSFTSSKETVAFYDDAIQHVDGDINLHDSSCHRLASL